MQVLCVVEVLFKIFFWLTGVLFSKITYLTYSWILHLVFSQWSWRLILWYTFPLASWIWLTHLAVIPGSWKLFFIRDILKTFIIWTWYTWNIHVLFCVCVCVCIYIYIHTYIENEEIFFWYILSFVLQLSLRDLAMRAYKFYFTSTIGRQSLF
jgi:hypothetical protein